MIALCKFRSSCYSAVLPVAGAHKQYETTSFRHLLNDLSGTAQMSGCGLEGNNVHALSYTMDITRVGGVPE